MKNKKRKIKRKKNAVQNHKFLNNLFGQINNLENYLEKDFEFHKEFKLPEVPDYDTMYDSDEEKKESKENDKIKKKEKNPKI